MASHLSILTDFYIFEFLLSSLLRCNRCAVHDLARNNIDAISIKTNIQQELPRRLISLERISIKIKKNIYGNMIIDIINLMLI